VGKTLPTFSIDWSRFHYKNAMVQLFPNASLEHFFAEFLNTPFIHANDDAGEKPFIRNSVKHSLSILVFGPWAGHGHEATNNKKWKTYLRFFGGITFQKTATDIFVEYVYSINSKPEKEKEWTSNRMRRFDEQVRERMPSKHPGRCGVFLFSLIQEICGPLPIYLQAYLPNPSFTYLLMLGFKYATNHYESEKKSYPRVKSVHDALPRSLHELFQSKRLCFIKDRKCPDVRLLVLYLNLRQSFPPAINDIEDEHVSDWYFSIPIPKPSPVNSLRGKALRLLKNGFTYDATTMSYYLNHDTKRDTSDATANEGHWDSLLCSSRMHTVDYGSGKCFCVLHDHLYTHHYIR
jgi:hypothetical protein